MTKIRMLPMTLAAGAMALASFTAAPARADDRALIGLLVGAAAIAIIANAAEAQPQPRSHRTMRPAPPRWNRAHWHRHHRAAAPWYLRQSRSWDHR